MRKRITAITASRNLSFPISSRSVPKLSSSVGHVCKDNIAIWLCWGSYGKASQIMQGGTEDDTCLAAVHSVRRTPQSGHLPTMRCTGDTWRQLNGERDPERSTNAHWSNLLQSLSSCPSCCGHISALGQKYVGRPRSTAVSRQLIF